MPEAPVAGRTGGPCRVPDDRRPGMRRAAIWRVSFAHRSASSTAARRAGSAGNSGGSGWRSSRNRAIRWLVEIRSPSAARPGTVPSRSPSRRPNGAFRGAARLAAGIEAVQPGAERVQQRDELHPPVRHPLVLQHQHRRATRVRAGDDIERVQLGHPLQVVLVEADEAVLVKMDVGAEVAGGVVDAGATQRRVALFGPRDRQLGTVTNAITRSRAPPAVCISWRRYGVELRTGECSTSKSSTRSSRSGSGRSSAVQVPSGWRTIRRRWTVPS